MKTPKQFRGFWKIESMAQWDTDYIDLLVPGFFDFDDDLMGSFQFGTVVGWLDCRVRQVGGEETLEWSWEGHSDTDSGSVHCATDRVLPNHRQRHVVFRACS